MAIGIGARLGPYEIIGPLGAGGMGEVYRARDAKLNREVAIKVLPAALADDPQYMARFEREAQTLAALNHPNIATVYGIEQGALVMELVEGPTLAERIAKGPVPLDEALPIARQIAEGLEAAHDRGIVHRDLKPANVKITPAGAVKLLDFGLAKTGGEMAAGTSNSISPTLSLAMTQAGYILGTAGYMSPEQARGHAVDRRTDIWAFGVVVWEMLTGRRMFDGGTVSDTMAAVLRADIDLALLPEDTPAAVRRMLRRCLHRERNRRLGDIADARLELDEPADAAAALAAPVATKSRAWLIAALAALALAGAGAAAWALWLRPAPPSLMVKFDIASQAGWTFGHSPAISPDGRRIAATVHLKNGSHALVLRSLDGLQTQLLPGGENGHDPVWSPDGRSLAFLTDGAPTKLKRIDIGGGPPVTICDVPVESPGRSRMGYLSWSGDGFILFSIQDSSYRVAAAGGIPAKLPAAPNVHRRAPQILPDNRHYLFRADGGATGIWAGSIDGTDARKLIDAPGHAAFVPQRTGADRGHLLFLRERTLMARPFDAARLEFTGDPSPVAETVLNASQNGAANYGASAAGVLAYQIHAETTSDLLRFDSAGRSEPLFEPVEFVEVAASPDGRRLITTEGNRRSSANRDLWMFDLERKVHTRFTFDPGRDENPVFSPDSSRVVWSSQRGAAVDLYSKLASGGSADDLLFRSPENKLPTDWSRDGRLLVFTSVGTKTRNDIWILPMAGDRKPWPFLKTEFAESHGVLSPDGNYLAYQSDESGRLQIYVRTFPDGSKGKWQVSEDRGGVQPLWSRDGKQLYYIAAGRDGRPLMATAVRLGPASAPSVQVDSPRALFESRVYGNPASARQKVAVLPDGGFVVVASSESVDAPLTVVLNWR